MEMVEEAKAEVREERGLEEVDRVVLEEYHEGLSAQILHLGPYSAEGETIKELREFIR